VPSAQNNPNSETKTRTQAAAHTAGQRRYRYEQAARAARLAGHRNAAALLTVLGPFHARVAPANASIHPSQEQLAGDLGCCEKTVHRYATTLVALGVLTVLVMRPFQQSSGRYTRQTNRYWLNTAEVNRLIRGGRERAGRSYRTGVSDIPPDGGQNPGAAPLSAPPTPDGGPAPPEKPPPDPGPDPADSYTGPTADGLALARAARAAAERAAGKTRWKGRK